jgi:DNA replication and repair protein RecF
MLLTRLRIARFRNIDEALVELGEGAHVIQGRNAQGKTNLLEAVYYLVTGRSFRARQDRDILPWGAPAGTKAFVEGEVKRRQSTTVLSVEIGADSKRALSDGKLLDRLGRLWGRLNAVLFTPADLALVQGGPSGRRRFLDAEIAQFDAAYLRQLQRCDRALRQRNALLRQWAGRPVASAKKALSPYEPEIIASGAALFAARARYLGKLAEEANFRHAIVSGQRETLELSYRPSLGASETLAEAAGSHPPSPSIEPAVEAGAELTMGAGAEESPTGFSARDPNPSDEPERLSPLEALFADKLDAALERDLRQGQTSVGPHRDDFTFLLGGRDAREFASQGQQRSCVLALRPGGNRTDALRRGRAPYAALRRYCLRARRLAPGGVLRGDPRGPATAHHRHRRRGRPTLRPRRDSLRDGGGLHPAGGVEGLSRLSPA